MTYQKMLPFELAHDAPKHTVSSSLLFNLEIPDLIDIQRHSFRSFLDHGFSRVVSKSKPLVFSAGSRQLQITFLPESIQFRRPEYTVQQSIRLGKSYGASVYIPVLLKSTTSEHLEVEWLLLGFLPLMLKEGHFLINGIPRVVLHQLVRNPGIYRIAKDSRTRVPTMRLVPEQGSWMNLTFDKKNRAWFTTRLLRRKISLLVLLQAFGFIEGGIDAFLTHSDFLGNSEVKRLNTPEKTKHDKILLRAGLEAHPRTQEDAWRYIYAHFQEYAGLTREDPVTTESAREFFWARVWAPKNTYIGQKGRHQLKTKINSPVSSAQHFLTGEDMLAATQGLLSLVSTEKLPDDIDSLSNKTVKGCGDFLEEGLAQGLKEFELTFARKLTTTSHKSIDPLWHAMKSLLAKSVSKSWKSFFTSGTLSQFMDETNPLAEVTHKRRLTVLGPGGVSGKQTTIQIRGIHPTFYGRLCPIETPEGQNAGLISSFSLFTQPTSTGTLKTPFFHVMKGQSQVNLPPLCVSPEQEYPHVIAPADIPLTPWQGFPKQRLPVRKQWNFEYGLASDLTLHSVGVLQILSVATSLIPFLEHDDANRALMGSNMQRQSVPVLKPQKPLVGTGLETRVLSDVNHLLQAAESGYVTQVTANTIQTVKPALWRGRPSMFSTVKNTASLSPGAFFWKKTASLSTSSPAVASFPRLGRPQKGLLVKEVGCPVVTGYTLPLYQRSNQSTTQSQRPVVREGCWVEKGDILGDGAASSRGKLALGQNLLVAYLPWEGYNFEDAILISERLVHEDVCTSLHVDYYEIEVKNTQHGLEQITSSIPLKINDSPQESTRVGKLNQDGLIEVGTWVSEGDYLVGKISPIPPKGPSVSHQYEKLYNMIMQRETVNFRNTSLRVPKGVEGFVLEVHHLPPKEAEVLALAEKDAVLRVRVMLLQRRKIQVGDKMAGRHGNKGIVSKILPRQDMPYLPDGTPVDIVLNPLGVPSRMNVGQLLECLLGLAGQYLHESYTTQLFDESYGAEASRSLVFAKLYEASLKTGNSWLFEPHHPGKMRIFDGRTGVPFDQPVTVGVAYILKLVHLVDDKIHARATGPYSAVTQQPVRGRSRNGGQRLGEMEVWALQAYGAAYILQELLTIKSDDVDGRKEAVFRIYTNKPFSSGPPESFKVLLRELQALCFDLRLDGGKEGTLGPQGFNLQRLESLR